MNISKHNNFYTIILLLIGISFILSAYSTGITGVTQKPGSNPGCTCHGPSPTSAVNVSISGPDTLTVSTESIYTITITGGPLAGGGTDIAASSGTLSTINSELIIMNSELTHFIPKSASAGSVKFQFSYTAPANVGTVTLYANGNSVNFNGNFTGDQWNFAPNKTIIIKNAPIAGINDNSKPLSFTLQQNYPNPFNPSTTISFSLAAASQVKLQIFDQLGKEVSLLVNDFKPAGNYSVNFSPQLPSGMYIYKLSAGGNSMIKKMLLIK
jgi:hypothetical protein